MSEMMQKSVQKRLFFAKPMWGKATAVEARTMAPMPKEVRAVSAHALCARGSDAVCSRLSWTREVARWCEERGAQAGGDVRRQGVCAPKQGGPCARSRRATEEARHV